MPVFKLTAKKSIRYKINRVLLVFYPICITAGLIYYFSYNSSFLWITVILPTILLFLLLLGNKIKPKHPFVQLNEDKMSWLLQNSVAVESILWKDIAWIKREDDGFIFYTQSSFSKHLSLYSIASDADKKSIIEFIVTTAQKTNTKLVYKNTITA